LRGIIGNQEIDWVVCGDGRSGISIGISTWLKNLIGTTEV
jgi:hypothetical protein